MLSRSATMHLSRRSSAMRRQRRRSHTSALYCATNGCASFLVVDPMTSVATCPICGFTRQAG
jgi:hypothetical protein